MDQTSNLTTAVRAEIAPLFDNLQKFVDRRIAELSMEIHATVQLAEYSESNLSGQLGRMQEQIEIGRAHV